MGLCGCCSRDCWDRVKRLFGLCSGASLVTFSVLSLITSIPTILNPVSWMSIVWAVWMIFFGLVLIALQTGDKMRARIVRFAGFLNNRVGRGLFYLFCGNCGGGMASAANIHQCTVPVAWLVLGMCWTMGFVEFCLPSSRPEVDEAAAPVVAPGGGLSSSLCANSHAAEASYTVSARTRVAAAVRASGRALPGTAMCPPSAQRAPIASLPPAQVNFTPGQAAQAATFAANNVTAEQAAAGARYATSGAAAWAAAQNPKPSGSWAPGGYGRE